MPRALCIGAGGKKQNPTLLPGQSTQTPDPASVKALSRAQHQGALLSILGNSWWGVFPPPGTPAAQGGTLGVILIFHFQKKKIINQPKQNGISWDARAFFSLIAFASLNPRPAAKNVVFKSFHQK